MIWNGCRSYTQADEFLGTYLFSQGDITQAEKKATGKDAARWPGRVGQRRAPDCGHMKGD